MLKFYFSATDDMREIKMNLKSNKTLAKQRIVDVAYLEPHMEKTGESSAKGILVLATVKGDVHDIGKNLVDIICTNNDHFVFIILRLVCLVFFAH